MRIYIVEKLPLVIGKEPSLDVQDPADIPWRSLTGSIETFLVQWDVDNTVSTATNEGQNKRSPGEKKKDMRHEAIQWLNHNAAPPLV